MVMFQFFLVFIDNFRISNEIQQPCPLNLELVKMMGESRVFMYPQLLPDLTFHQTKPGILLLILLR